MRVSLDAWFPTVLRYAGVVLILYAAIIDQGRNPALIPSAIGMIGFKSVYESGDGRRD